MWINARLRAGITPLVSHTAKGAHWETNLKFLVNRLPALRAVDHKDKGRAARSLPLNLSRVTLRKIPAEFPCATPVGHSALLPAFSKPFALRAGQKEKTARLLGKSPAQVVSPFAAPPAARSGPPVFGARRSLAAQHQPEAVFSHASALKALSRISGRLHSF